MNSLAVPFSLSNTLQMPAHAEGRLNYDGLWTTVPSLAAEVLV